MNWEEIFKGMNSKKMEDAEKDIEWILTALEDPSYLMVKGDNSNMFLLNDSDIYYVEYVRKVLQERGYILQQADRGSNAVSVISEREATLRDRLKVNVDIKSKGNSGTGTEKNGKIPEQEDSEQEGSEPGN